MTSNLSAASPVLKASPNLTNLSDIFNDPSSDSSLRSATIKFKCFDVSTEVISEEPEELDDTTLTTIDCKTYPIARQMYNQEYSELDVRSYISYLGGEGTENYEACKEFMSFCEPWSTSLVKSLRILSSKLYLNGETIHIDKVLETFAKSWYKSHKSNPIGDYKAIHIVCFALFILNSDLYNSQNFECKFTKADFVNSTMDALREANSTKLNNKSALTSELRVFYDSICEDKLQILKVKSSKRNSKKSSIKPTEESSSPIAQCRVNSMSNISMKSNRSSKRYSSLGSSLFTDRDNTLIETDDINYDVQYKQEIEDEKLERLGAPWRMEGSLKCEYSTLPKKKKKSWFSKLNRNNNVITSELDIYKSKGWKHSLVIISKGLLKQYSFKSSLDSEKFIKTKSEKYVSTLMTYNLYSATASLIEDNIVSNSMNNIEGHAWLLTVPNTSKSYENGKNSDEKSNKLDDKKIVFYAPSIEIANGFIETINFWAARITSIPTGFDDIVTNMEYGWSDEVLRRKCNLKEVKIQRWETIRCLESSFIPTSHPLTEQFERIQMYVTYLEDELADHHALRPILEKIWGESSKLKDSHQKAISNWNEKYVYLFKQHKKYNTYLESLAFALSFRATRI